jgi:NTP pyrophosphatase (non-canonical NTP hydrolase)
MTINTADAEHPRRAALSISGLQAAVDHWIKTHGVRYFSEMTNLAVLVEEVGELARIMSRTYGEQSFKGEAAATDLGDELTDVLFVLVCIANQTGVDLESAMAKNLKKKSARDNRRHRNNPKLKS